MSNRAVCTSIGSVSIFTDAKLPGTMHVRANFACEQVPGGNDPCSFTLLVTVDKWINGWQPIDAGQFLASGSNCQDRTINCGDFDNMNLIETSWHSHIGPGTFMINAVLYSGKCAQPGSVLASQSKIVSFI